MDKPKLVFFFDEAHLLFSDLPQMLEEKIEQVVRLIRSKGVGIYFVTQNPTDVPQVILSQLGNRVQHALRAFTPIDQKAVRAAAQTFRPNPKLSVEKVITELGVGEGLVSFLDEKGTPGMVERALVCPPHSQIGAITPQQRQQLIQSSVVAGIYEKAVDRESAYEKLKGRAAAPAQPQAPSPSGPASSGPASSGPSWYDTISTTVGNLGLGGSTGPRGGRRSDTVMDAMVKSAARSIGNSVGRQLVRGVLGSLLSGR
jgi:DNA helicase HerA-like ATPase